MSETVYDLTILARYSYRADAYIKLTKSPTIDELANVLNPSDNITTNYTFNPSPSDIEEICNVLTAEYLSGKSEEAFKHASNIYFLLLECFLEIRHYKGYKDDLPDYFAVQDFIGKFLKIKADNRDGITITVADGQTSAKLVLDNKSKFFNNNILKAISEYLNVARLQNKLLFENINFESLSTDKIKLLPELVRSKEFQIAHYALIILEYFNREVENKKYPALNKFTNIQRRAVFDLFRISNLSDCIVDQRIYESLLDGPKGDKSRTVTENMKKFLENHLTRRDSSYKLSVEDLA